jgi:hypothetical protein
MSRHLLVKARRPVPSGRAAQSARVLPVRACSARGCRHRPAVRGSAWPGQDARHCSPPTVFVKRIRAKVQDGTVAEATAKPRFFRQQAIFLNPLTILCTCNDCAKFARNSRNGHNLAGPLHYASASASIPRTGPVRALSIAFPRPHTFSVHVQSASAIHPQPIRSMSGKCPRSVQCFSRLLRERRVCCSRNRELPNDGSAIARNRAGCAFDCCLSPAAYQSLWVCRAFLLAFRVVLLASSGGRPHFSHSLCCRASLAESVGFCPLAPDWRTAIDSPGNSPRSIAVRSVAVRLNSRRWSSLRVLCFNSASGAPRGKSKETPNQKQ